MKISEHCYLISGLSVESPWAVNSGFIVGRHSTLIIDTGSNYLSAQTIYGYARCAKPDNRLIAVNTELHFDHIGGNCLFREKNIDIFAYPGANRKEEEFIRNKKDFNDTIPNDVRREQQEAEIFFYKTELVNPNRELSHNDNIDLGDVNVTVVATPGHTPRNISLFVPSDGVLYCGDCIVTGYIPNLEAGHTADWQTWLKSIDILKKLKPDIIVPGHGHSISGPEQIETELKNIQHILQKSLKDKKPPTQ